MKKIGILTQLRFYESLNMITFNMTTISVILFITITLINKLFHINTQQPIVIYYITASFGILSAILTIWYMIFNRALVYKSIYDLTLHKNILHIFILPDKKDNIEDLYNQYKNTKSIFNRNKYSKILYGILIFISNLIVSLLIYVITNDTVLSIIFAITYIISGILISIDIENITEFIVDMLYNKLQIAEYVGNNLDNNDYSEVNIEDYEGDE